MKKTFAESSSLQAIFLLIFLLQFYPLRAQDELSAAQVRERLQVIQQMLQQGKSNANCWWNGWLIGYSTATVGQGIVYLSSGNKSTRQDMALGAASTFLGAVGQVLAPMTPGTAPSRLAVISESTSAQAANKLLAAEKLLKESARREREGRSWQMHAITGLVNLGSGLITWLGFKRTVWEGIGNFALNTAITEAQIWTQPTRAIQDYDKYNIKYKTAGQTGCRNTKINFSFALCPGGFGIAVRF